MLNLIISHVLLVHNTFSTSFYLSTALLVKRYDNNTKLTFSDVHSVGSLDKPSLEAEYGDRWFVGENAVLERKLDVLQRLLEMNRFDLGTI